MKELGKIMLFDFRTVGGSQVIQFMSGFGVLIILAGLFIMPVAFLYITLMIPLLLISPLTAVADKSGFNKLYGTLPVNRKNIPRARFLYIFALCTAAEIIGGVLSVISVWAQLYRFLPETSHEFREMFEEAFTFKDGLPLMLRMTFVFSVGIMLILSVFTMVKMIHGSASAGMMGGIAVTVLLLLVLAFFVLNSLDIMPVIELKGLFRLKDPITAMSAVKWVIWHAVVFGICMLCGEHTAKKLAGREL